MKKYRIVINGKTYERVASGKKRPPGQNQKKGQPQGNRGQAPYPGIPQGASAQRRRSGTQQRNQNARQRPQNRQQRHTNPQNRRPNPHPNPQSKQQRAKKSVYHSPKRRRYRVRTRFKVLVIGLCIFIVMGFSYVLSPLVGSEQEMKNLQEESVQTAAEPKPEKADPDKSGKNRAADADSKADRSSEYLLLVNKQHGLGDKTPPDDLITLKVGTKRGVTTENNKLRKVPAKHFYSLVQGAKKRGFEITVTSAFRPYAYQKKLHDRYEEADGSVKANTYSAKAGYSEHETGLCLDVSSPSVNYNLAQAYGTTEEGKWLAEHAHNYGFIIRYPKGKEKITGYDYEPWHIRYVGKAAAGEIYKNNQTLEEYLDKN